MTEKAANERRSEIIKFIDALRLTDPYIRTIFTNGGCYKFALFLKHVYPDGVLITNWNFDHVMLLIDGQGYDIYGDAGYEAHNWHVMTQREKEAARKWSFAGQRMVQIGECPACDEPLVA